MKKRIFLGIVPPPNIITLLKNHHKPELSVRWTKPENLHVTLIFFGDIEEIQIFELLETTQQICSQYQTFNLSLERIVSYRYMVWATIKPDSIFNALHQKLASALSQKKISVQQDRSFRPHINLARAIQGQSLENFEPIDISGNDFDATHIVVFESQLKITGPTYISLDAFELTGRIN